MTTIDAAWKNVAKKSHEAIRYLDRMGVDKLATAELLSIVVMSIVARVSVLENKNDSVVVRDAEPRKTPVILDDDITSMGTAMDKAGVSPHSTDYNDDDYRLAQYVYNARTLANAVRSGIYELIPDKSTDIDVSVMEHAKRIASKYFVDVSVNDVVYAALMLLQWCKAMQKENKEVYAVNADGLVQVNFGAINGLLAKAQAVKDDSKLCAKCEGTGLVADSAIPGTYYTCSDCKDEHEMCPACNGLGTGCINCDGTGKVKAVLRDVQ